MRTLVDELTGARAVAAMYRARLLEVAPHSCLAADILCRAAGETWLLEREDDIDPDTELTTAQAAELARVPIRRIREWAQASHPEDRSRPLLPRFKMRGRERTYLAQHVLDASAAMHRYRLAASAM